MWRKVLMVPHLVWGMESPDVRSGLNDGMNVGMKVVVEVVASSGCPDVVGT